MIPAAGYALFLVTAAIVGACLRKRRAFGTLLARRDEIADVERIHSLSRRRCACASSAAAASRGPAAHIAAALALLDEAVRLRPGCAALCGECRSDTAPDQPSRSAQLEHGSR